MHSVWYLVHGVWGVAMVPAARWAMHGAWYLVYGVWGVATVPLRGGRCMVRGELCVERCAVHGATAQCTLHGRWAKVRTRLR